jgi:alpha-L-fucosidase
MKNQIEELVTRYGEIAVFWFDGEWYESWTSERAKEIRDLIVKHQPSVILANRIGQRKPGDGDYVSPENFTPYIGNHDKDWETCTIFDGRWFYIPSEKSRTAEWALRTLTYCAGRGGNLLLNTGPDAQGHIIEPTKNEWAKVGNWLQRYGESVYGTRKGVHYFLPWGSNTRKKHTLYYHIFEWPEDGQLLIPGLEADIEKAFLLGADAEKDVKFKSETNGIILSLPLEKPDPIAGVLVLETGGNIHAENVIRPLEKTIPAHPAGHEPERKAGDLFLPAGFARLQGPGLQFHHGIGSGGQRGHLLNWFSAEDIAEWEIKIDNPGNYKVRIGYSSPCRGGEFQISVAGQKLKSRTMDTGKHNWADFLPFYLHKTQYFDLGKVHFNKPGHYILSMHANKIMPESVENRMGLLKLREITLSEVKQ